MIPESRIPLILIEIPGLDRSKPLIEILTKTKIFDLIIFPAVMFKSGDINWKVDHKYLKTSYGRKITDGEIGAAISHKEAQKILALSEIGGVILEDDARIEDLELFEDLVKRFIRNIPHSKSVLSLLPWVHLNVYNLESKKRKRNIYKLLGSTPLSVGYVISKAAASELAAANELVRYLPDWPENNVNFFTSIEGVICHGDINSKSVIGDGSRVKVSKIKKILIYSGFAYLRNYKLFGTPWNYIRMIYRPYVFWKLDNYVFSRKSLYLRLKSF